MNNEEKTHFYINKCINENNWHSIWYFKNIEIIAFQIYLNNSLIKSAIYELINIYEIYNFFSFSHNEIMNKNNY